LAMRCCFPPPSFSRRLFQFGQGPSRIFFFPSRIEGPCFFFLECTGRFPRAGKRESSGGVFPPGSTIPSPPVRGRLALSLGACWPGIPRAELRNYALFDKWIDQLPFFSGRAGRTVLNTRRGGVFLFLFPPPPESDSDHFLCVGGPLGIFPPDSRTAAWCVGVASRFFSSFLEFENPPVKEGRPPFPFLEEGSVFFPFFFCQLLDGRFLPPSFLLVESREANTPSFSWKRVRVSFFFFRLECPFSLSPN